VRTLSVQNHGNLIYFGDIGFLFMEDCAPFAFLVSWALVALYLCFRFYIFDRFWKSMFLGLVGGGGPPTLVMFTCNVKWLSSCN
jgi:hypothetical protein